MGTWGSGGGVGGRGGRGGRVIRGTRRRSTGQGAQRNGERGIGQQGTYTLPPKSGAERDECRQRSSLS